jgi:outer membrane protein OmpA-like peptidoglycan-associated protein
MFGNQLALTPQALRTLDRWHWVIFLVLLLLLFLLPTLFGIGPNGWRQCGAPAVKAAAPAPLVTPAPAPEPAKPAAAVSAKAVVYFDTAKFDVKAKGMADVKGLVGSAGASAKYAISGFHDSRGDSVANAELAKNRAFAVRDVLKAAGVAEDRIDLRKPQVTAGSDKLADDPEARRVEVTIEP